MLELHQYTILDAPEIYIHRNTKMSKKLQEYLSKIKNQNPQDGRFPRIKSLTSSVNHRKLPKVFSGCKHQPKTLSFTIDHNHTFPRQGKKEQDERGEATLSDIDRFLVENFKSLYGNKDDENETSDQSICPGDMEEENKRLGKFFKDDPQPDPCALTEDGGDCSSDSSFFTQALASVSGKNGRVGDECIVVLKRSCSLYEDFWKSMKEVIEGRLENGGRADGEFWQEMLLCFLNLNEKKYYRYIVSAFLDLTADSRQVSRSTFQTNDPPTSFK